MCDDRRYHILRSGCEIPYIPSELSEPMSRLILAALADHTNTKGLVYVSARTLAAELDISSNTVFIGYRLFELEGLLERTGKRVGSGGTIEYRMVVEHLAPKNPRFVPLSESRNASPRAVRQRSNQCTEGEQLTDEPFDGSGDLATISGTDTPSDTPSDAAIRERSGNRSGSGNRNENPNTHRNHDLRAADIEVLFSDALNLELQYRPSNVPLDILKAKKWPTYSKASEKVLDTYPRARPSLESDRDLALAVCEIMNPDNPLFRIGPTTRQVIYDRYKSDPVEYLARRFTSTESADIDF